MEGSPKACARCGDPREANAGYCGQCGHAIAADGRAADGDGATSFRDTVRLRPRPGEADDAPVVRPSLAIMFRMAVGPGSDHYAPRFMEFERIGRSVPGWNWASLWVPSAWAFYRKLWVAGTAFALWPLVAVAAFRLIEPYLGDSGLVLLACAVVLVWLVPGAVASLIADTLVYRKARRRVRRAQAKAVSPQAMARMLASHPSIAPGSAVFLGGAALMLSAYLTTSSLQSAYADRVIRSRIAEVLTIAQPLQQQVEQWWGTSGGPLATGKRKIVGVKPQAALVDEMDVSLVNGRVRVTLGSAFTELYGRTILLAPALDRFQELWWICIPVGIPARYLPPECRKH